MQHLNRTALDRLCKAERALPWEQPVPCTNKQQKPNQSVKNFQMNRQYTTGADDKTNIS